MRRLTLTLGLVAVLGLGACGGGGSGKKSAPTTQPPPTAPPVTAPLTGSDQAATPFCQLARTYTDKYASLVQSAGDPAKLRAATTDTEAAIRQAQATAPPAIKPDVVVVATTAGQVLAGLQRNNFELAKTPEIAELQQPGFQRSFASLNAYVQAHCGVS